MVVRMENWCAVPTINSVYMPPEQRGTSVKGQVYGHKRFEDGDSIVTSRIIGVDGRTVTTESGTQYVLGEINADYLKWCENTDGVRVPTEEVPIRLHKAGG